MKVLTWLIGAAVLMGAVLAIVNIRQPKPKVTGVGMKLSSPAFMMDGHIPDQYGCKGHGISPPLQIQDVPAGAKSLALIVDDPDAPGRTFVHWVAWNIEPHADQLDEGSTPIGASVGTNGAGQNQYYPPCPPSGIHHYHFKLWALDTKLNLSPNTDAAKLDEAIKDHILEQAELVGTYQRYF